MTSRQVGEVGLEEPLATETWGENTEVKACAVQRQVGHVCDRPYSLKRVTGSGWITSLMRSADRILNARQANRSTRCRPGGAALTSLWLNGNRLSVVPEAVGNLSAVFTLQRRSEMP